MNISLSTVKFYTGVAQDWDSVPPENGAIYFIPDDNGNATIAYDMNDRRYWNLAPAVVTVADLGSNWTPKAGEIVVVTDASELNGEPQPAIKIGDGITSSNNLPYIGDDTDIAALRAVVNAHINRQDIHFNHTVTDTTYIINKAPITVSI